MAKPIDAGTNARHYCCDVRRMVHFIGYKTLPSGCELGHNKRRAAAAEWGCFTRVNTRLLIVFDAALLTGQRCSGSRWRNQGVHAPFVFGVDGSQNVPFDGPRVRCWTQEQISFFSDVIASGTLIETQRLGRLEGFENWEDVGLRAVEMTFSISHTFKGDVPPDAKIVVRYYEVPQVGSLERSIDTNAAGAQKYLLYLLQEANNRFALTAGPTEVRLCIRPEHRKDTSDSGHTATTAQPTGTTSPTPVEPASSQPAAAQ